MDYTTTNGKSSKAFWEKKNHKAWIEIKTLNIFSLSVDNLSKKDATCRCRYSNTYVLDIGR